MRVYKAGEGGNAAIQRKGKQKCVDDVSDGKPASSDGVSLIPVVRSSASQVSFSFRHFISGVAELILKALLTDTGELPFPSFLSGRPAVRDVVIVPGKPVGATCTGVLFSCGKQLACVFRSSSFCGKCAFLRGARSFPQTEISVVRGGNKQITSSFGRRSGCGAPGAREP